MHATGTVPRQSPTGETPPAQTNNNRKPTSPHQSVGQSSSSTNANLSDETDTCLDSPYPSANADTARAP
eukprot:1945649-Lingulodinium_polyedra.AAC.1